MSEVRVRLPLGALISVWESLEIRLVRDQEIVGSNPTTLTLRCGGACAGTSRRLLTALSQVRFLSPQLYGRASQSAMAAVSKTVEHSQRCLEGSTPSPSALITTRALGRAAKAPAFQAGQAGSIPAEHFLN